MPQGKTIGLIVTLAAIGGLIAYFESTKPTRVSFENAGGPLLALPADQELRMEDVVSLDGNDLDSTKNSDTPQPFQPKPSGEYPVVREIVSSHGFVNVEPFKLADIVGKKVILVDFWTYSCINCQRTTPYLNAWYEKYKDEGFEIVGVHTPEFEFEKNYENVVRAVREAGIQYPVVLDNDYGTWTAYGNRFWPRKYLVDINGNIVYDHIGEGAYEETERRIQKLLSERKLALGEAGGVSGGMARPAEVIEVDETKPRSVEIYFGAARNEYLRNGKPFMQGVQILSAPSLVVRTGDLYLVGEWNLANEYAENRSAGARIIFRYIGENVYFVASSETGSKLRVLRDGVVLDKEAGVDVQGGTLSVQEERLYEIVEGSAYGEHTLEFIIEAPGLRAFTFTFG